MSHSISTRLNSLARAALLAAATLAAGAALAGHLNTLLTADLDGRQEVNTGSSNALVGDPRGRGEVYVFGIDESRTVLCYHLQVSRIDELELAPGNGRAAHIHRGKRGENGPVVANLAWPQDGQAADCLNAVTQPARFGGVDAATAQALIADILANPGDYYINVHNTAHPGGAVRGQLRPAP